jgi:hypothetical protein
MKITISHRSFLRGAAATAVAVPYFIVSLRDAEGNLLGATNQVIRSIVENGSVVFVVGNFVATRTGMVASVELSMDYDVIIDWFFPREVPVANGNIVNLKGLEICVT